MTEVSERDANLLLETVREIEEVLEWLANGEGHRFLLQPSASGAEFYEHLQPAWDKVSSRFEAVKADIEALGEGVEDHPSQIHRRRRQAWKLDQHGLLGAELRFKHSVIKWLAEQLWEFKDIRWIRRFLGVANSFLSSLSGAIPGAGAISEFKDMLEAILGDITQGANPDPGDG